MCKTTCFGRFIIFKYYFIKSSGDIVSVTIVLLKSSSFSKLLCSTYVYCKKTQAALF